MAVAGVEEYRKILGVAATATPDELKKAYRRRAIQLHPDRNNSPTAHEDFILLTEAYEYLSRGDVDYTYTTSYDTTWEATEREQARERAAQYAQMRYGNFTRSDYYREMQNYYAATSQVILFLGILVGIIIPVVSIGLYGSKGFFSLIFSVVTLPFIIKETLSPSEPAVKGHVLENILQLANGSVFRASVLTAANIWVLFKIGMQTFITPGMLAGMYVLAIVVGYIVARLSTLPEDRFERRFYAFCVAPMVVNAFLIANFLFSSHPVTETYGFSTRVESSRHGQQSTSFIYLSEGKYAEYPGLRCFIDYSEMQYARDISYTFEDGLFGVRVMTGYTFND